MDSVLILADIALSYDNKIGEAYSVKSAYYYFISKTEQALEEAERAIKFNPNDWMPYWGNGIIYSDLDFVKSIDNYTRAISLNRSSMLPNLRTNLGWVYHHAGFVEKFRGCIQEAVKLTGDSAGYYADLGSSENHQGNYAKAIEFLEKGHKIDTNRLDIIISLGYSHMFLGHFRESLKYYKTYVERLEASGGGDLQNMQRVGYVYWQNGYKKEAEYYFNKQLEYCNESIELGREYSRNLSAFYDLAGIYAFRGDRDQAIENLRKFNQRKWMNFFISRLIKQDPLFDSIRNDPEFLEIVRILKGNTRQSMKEWENGWKSKVRWNNSIFTKGSGSPPFFSPIFTDTHAFVPGWHQGLLKFSHLRDFFVQLLRSWSWLKLVLPFSKCLSNTTILRIIYKHIALTGLRKP